MRTYYFADEVSYHKPFSIINEQRREAFRAEGDFFSFTGNITLYSADGDKLLLIKKKLWTFLTHYGFYIGNEQVFEIRDQSFLGGFDYIIEGLPWRIDGDVWGKDYGIYNENQVLATVKMIYRPDADSYYEIIVYEEDDTVFILAIMLILELILVKVEKG